MRFFLTGPFDLKLSEKAQLREKEASCTGRELEGVASPAQRSGMWWSERRVVLCAKEVRGFACGFRLCLLSLVIVSVSFCSVSSTGDRVDRDSATHYY